MKILIIDDHAVFSEGLKLILRDRAGFEDIDNAITGKEGLEYFKENKYDLVILDISLPDVSGLEILNKINKLQENTKVLMLSMHPQEHYAIRSLKSGAMGYLTKETAPEELVNAVKKILSGKKYISDSITEQIFARFDKPNTNFPHEVLSEREFEIMIFIARGDSLNTISKKLFISNKTVSTYRSRVMEKMNMTKNAELTAYCIKNELM